MILAVRGALEAQEEKQKEDFVWMQSFDSIMVLSPRAAYRVWVGAGV